MLLVAQIKPFLKEMESVSHSMDNSSTKDTASMILNFSLHLSIIGVPEATKVSVQCIVNNLQVLEVLASSLHVSLVPKV